MATTPDDVTKLLSATLGGAENARRELLLRLEQDAIGEARAYKIRRDALAKVAPNDPRLAILDARIQGAERLGEFVHQGRADWVVAGIVHDAAGNLAVFAQVTLDTPDDELRKLFGDRHFTGNDGRFEGRLSEQDMNAIFQRGPKASVVVTSADGKQTAKSSEFQVQAGRVELFDLTLAPVTAGPPVPIGPPVPAGPLVPAEPPVQARPPVQAGPPAPAGPPVKIAAKAASPKKAAAKPVKKGVKAAKKAAKPPADESTEK